MKFAETWLREWVNPKLDAEELGQQLTMAGHEVNSIESQGSELKGVVIAEVVRRQWPGPGIDVVDSLGEFPICADWQQRAEDLLLQ